jgi:hypothetical protein
MMQFIDLQGKRKPRFSLSEEQKVPLGLFATLSTMYHEKLKSDWKRV